MKRPVLAGTLPILHQGKVRDTYGLPPYPGFRLIHATDRVSTHNILHRRPIPKKGEVLLALTLFWEQLLHLKKGTYTHTIAFGKKIYDFLPKGASYPENFHLEALVVQRVQMFPYEFVFRARMAGSLWKDYYSQGIPNPYGLTLPRSMRLMDEFARPIFTPTDKSATDEPVGAELIQAALRREVGMLRAIYDCMRDHALAQGIDIVDTKLEAGRCNGRMTLADEWGTPDSSRFVEASSITPGEEPLWLDKQFLRQEAERTWSMSVEGKRFPLWFSDQAIEETVKRYHEIVERLTGQSLHDLQKSLGMTA